MVEKKRILIVEGNTREENKEFTQVGINTHTESLIKSIDFYKKNLEIDIANPSSDQNLTSSIESLDKYDGLIWGGSSLNIYNDTEEIRRQINFMRECQKKIRKILAICWGLQVAVTAAGGEVKQGKNGAHRGIAHEITINSEFGRVFPAIRTSPSGFTRIVCKFKIFSLLIFSGSSMGSVVGFNSIPTGVIVVGTATNCESGFSSDGLIFIL